MVHLRAMAPRWSLRVYVLRYTNSQQEVFQFLRHEGLETTGQLRLLSRGIIWRRCRSYGMRQDLIADICRLHRVLKESNRPGLDL